MSRAVSTVWSPRGLALIAILGVTSLSIGAHVAVSYMSSVLGLPAYGPAHWWTPLDLIRFSFSSEQIGKSVVLTGWMMGMGAAVACAGASLLLISLLSTPHRTQDSHGTARWADREDVVRGRLLDVPTDGRSLIVGGWIEDDRRRTGPEFLTHSGPESVLTTAPSRSGKTASLVIPNLLCYEASALVLDVKGELWEATSGYRQAELGQMVLYHDPASEEPGSARFNPLAEIDITTERAIRDVQMLVQYLVYSDEKQNDSSNHSHFIASARSLAVGVFLYEMARAARVDPDRPATITGVLSAITRSDRPIVVYLSELGEFDDGQPAVTRVIRETANEMLQRESREFSGVLSSLITPLTTFRDPILARATSHSDFGIADLVSMDSPITVYLTIRPSDRDRLKHYFGLIVNLVCRKLMDRLPTRDRPRHELLLMLDEFRSLPPLPVVQESMDQMPGYGIKAFIVLQDYETLLALYGEHETLSSNCRVQIAYTPSKPKTAKLLSEATGASTVRQATRSESRKAVGVVPTSMSDGEGFHQRPLLTPDEIMRLGTAEVDEQYRMIAPGEALIFVRGLHPIRGVQTPYFMHDELAKRARYPAPEQSDRPRQETPSPTGEGSTTRDDRVSAHA